MQKKLDFEHESKLEVDASGRISKFLVVEGKNFQKLGEEGG